MVQARAAAEQHRPLARGTHAKGVCARAQFEVLRRYDRTGSWAGGTARQGHVRYAWRISRGGAVGECGFEEELRFQARRSIHVFLGRPHSEWLCCSGYERGPAGFFTAKYPAAADQRLPCICGDHEGTGGIESTVSGLLSLPFKDKLRVLRVLALAKVASSQKIRPYQQLRYWSNVPFRHGPVDVVQYSAIPSSDNLARPLQKSNPKGLQEELIRHLNEDGRMSSFDFSVQLLDADKMTYWGKRHDANFWIENASVKWKETEAPFHKVARLTLLPQSHLRPDAGEVIYFDVTRHSTPDSTPIGSINRARRFGEAASREARLRVSSSPKSAISADVSVFEPIAAAKYIE